ncbi:MAG TPA: zinc-finger-containing protein, partial [Chitinophagales bacterium]|nr:zinc-finger-containing protein [Chitinophagales bacterium]
MTEVDLFIPCFIDQMFPETGFNMVKVLEKAGCRVHYNPNQTCCGQPAFNAGYWKEMEDVGKKFLADFANSDRYVVGPSGSCVGFVRNFYGELYANTPVHNYHKNLKKNLFEFSEFLVDVLKVEDFGGKFPAKVTYHDACGALRECKILAHKYFDAIWKERRLMKRKAAYLWLSERLGIPPQYTHIGMFGCKTCLDV